MHLTEPKFIRVNPGPDLKNWVIQKPDKIFGKPILKLWNLQKRGLKNWPSQSLAIAKILEIIKLNSARDSPSNGLIDRQAKKYDWIAIAYNPID